MTAADAPRAASIAAESPGEGWTQPAFQQEITANGGARYLVVESEGVVVGYAGLWLVVDLAHITNMGVTIAAQRRGLGRLLLYGLFDVARRSEINAVTLEVRPSNEPARALYRSFGFHEAGLRKAYYRDTGEDAIIMTTEELDTPPMHDRLASIRISIEEQWPGISPVITEAEFDRWVSSAG